MNPAFFILDEEFVQKINFNKKKDYYIASLNCNLILKEDIKKDNEKMIDELSEKSRLLLEKGAAYQNDIGWLASYILLTIAIFQGLV